MKKLKFLFLALLILGGIAFAREAEAGTIDQLIEASKDTSVDIIWITANIDAPDSKSNGKSNTAIISLDRNITIQSKGETTYTIKHTGISGSSNYGKSLFEAWGNGNWDGITITFENIILDGGAVWNSSYTTAKTRQENYNTCNSGVYGRGIVDIANKATVNLENKCTLQNCIVNTNSITRGSNTNPISGGSSNYGAGVRVEYSTGKAGGTINVKAGAVIKNCISNGWGGAIGAYNYGRLNMYGGELLNCAASAGAGICGTFKNSTDPTTSGVVKIYGGKIEGCYASSSGYGGAICLSGGNDSTPNTSYILGGSFGNNTAKDGNGNSIACESGPVKLFLPSGGLTGVNINTISCTLTKVEITVHSVTINDTPESGKQSVLYVGPNSDTGNPLGPAFPANHEAPEGQIFDKWLGHDNKTYTKTSTITSDVVISPKYLTHTHGSDELYFWDYGGSLPEKENKFYALNKDVYLTSDWACPAGTKICLNGHSISGSENVKITVPSEKSLGFCKPYEGESAGEIQIPVEVSGGDFSLDSLTASSLTVTDGTCTVTGLVTINSLSLATGKVLTLGSELNDGSTITLTSTPNTGVITSGFGSRNLGSIINLPSTAKTYMLMKTKNGELKVSQHKSGW